ncbi:MAG: dihydrofolate reductase [Myxococcota bacterium]
MTRGIVVAATADWVIGLDGKLPWHYPADLKRFKRLTVGTTVIMGRLTWESLPRKPLPDRENIVVTSDPSRVSGAATARSLEEAMGRVAGDIWFIGGARIYAEAMAHSDVIDMTWVPDVVQSPAAVLFPEIDAERFRADERQPHPDDPRLDHQRFVRRVVER